MMKNKEYQREQLTIKFGTYYYKEVLIIIYLKQSYLYLAIIFVYCCCFLNGI